MASSAHPEGPLGAWDALKRLRDISRLVLAAIERDDLDEVARLAREGDALTAIVAPVIASHQGRPELPEGVDDELTELGHAYSNIVAGLGRRARETQRELGDVRRTRTQLRLVGLKGSDEPAMVDRQT